MYIELCCFISLNIFQSGSQIFSIIYAMMEDYLLRNGVIEDKSEKGNCCNSCEITAPKWEIVKDLDD